jgi:uncharacterized protein YecE (DUF72 family)
MQTQQNFYTGLSGIALPVPKYKFPPEHRNSSRLSYYATFFNTIEINNSFYKIPLKGTLRRWAESVPENFIFTFKLLREITHVKGLQFTPSQVFEFIDAITAVGRKKGCLLIQLPPSLGHEHAHQLESLLRNIQTADPEGLWKTAVEFRSKDWYNQDVFEMLEEFDATLVLHDMPASPAPMNQVHSDVVYLRFHGPTGNYRGSYTHAFLNEYTEYITEWLSEGKRVFAYLNNTAGDAFNNCVTLSTMVRL